MKEILTMISSLLVILFSLSVLFLADDTSAEPESSSVTIPDLASRPPQTETVLFKRVMGVRVHQGVLIFVTREQEGLKDHYFPLRGKNVFLCRPTSSRLPADSIQFASEGLNGLRITFSPTLKIDLQEQLTTDAVGNQDTKSAGSKRAEDGIVRNIQIERIGVID